MIKTARKTAKLNFPAKSIKEFGAISAKNTL